MSVKQQQNVQQRMTQIELSRGVLSLQLTESTWPLADLLGFAERVNPKRAFLFVSKVLGRHIPVAPATMRRAFTNLANQIPDGLAEPILLVGMAETAVGLAAGVHQVLQQRYPQTLYLATTRHPIDAPLWAAFREEHSHAPAHLLYGSDDPLIQAQLAQVKTLVLVDDEASTGQTFVNLAQALRREQLPDLQQVITATLADWAPPLQFDGLAYQAVSLLKGQWSWQDHPNATLPQMPDVATVAHGEWTLPRQQTWGRQPTLTPYAALHATAQHGERVLVLGSNELVWAPFVLAEQLAAQGAVVKFAATTRSPIALGHDVRTAFRFADQYGLGMINFIYNVDPSAYDRVIWVIETATESVDPAWWTWMPQLEVISLSEQEAVCSH